MIEMIEVIQMNEMTDMNQIIEIIQIELQHCFNWAALRLGEFRYQQGLRGGFPLSGLEGWLSSERPWGAKKGSAGLAEGCRLQTYLRFLQEDVQYFN